MTTPCSSNSSSDTLPHDNPSKDKSTQKGASPTTSKLCDRQKRHGRSITLVLVLWLVWLVLKPLILGFSRNIYYHFSLSLEIISFGILPYCQTSIFTTFNAKQNLVIIQLFFILAEEIKIQTQKCPSLLPRRLTSPSEEAYAFNVPVKHILLRGEEEGILSANSGHDFFRGVSSQNFICVKIPQTPRWEACI